LTADIVDSGPHWQRFATAEAEEAHSYIRRALVDIKVWFSGEGRDGVGFRTAAAELDDLTVTRMHYSSHTRLRTLPAGNLNIAHLIAGRYALTRGKDEYRLRPGDDVLVLPDEPVEVDFDGLEVVTVKLARPLIEEVALAQTGISGADLRFDGSRPISAHLGRHWSQTVAFLTRTVLADPALMTNPLITGQARELLAATALAVFPNSSLSARPQPGGGVTPQVLNRAMAYVDENIERALTVWQIAAAAGVGPRALQLAFRRYRDTTPMQHVRRVRLERAHRDLQVAEPASGVTVEMIATRWGFAHPGRFSTDYRAAYGSTPSHTLRT
jgi:AraC-like DNA-binding protein